ncbi:HNH endonuclease signature motif containing protein [Litorihabitans aurantiacus]|uniref:HNH nuclease domain-containing protein n=1 Tax=Litorihabitans aurantiacus TaxID=1930061 RepID=A0AA38CRR0_9MICO|nr:HNH endonuclease signature motif containing protein [Litorihabitans aurantiacus]GMA32081.1 hypothetical protein GCM10025875_20730 [Litorihabitans aurantiacus]
MFDTGAWPGGAGILSDPAGSAPEDVRVRLGLDSPEAGGPPSATIERLLQLSDFTRLVQLSPAELVELAATFTAVEAWAASGVRAAAAQLHASVARPVPSPAPEEGAKVESVRVEVVGAASAELAMRLGTSARHAARLVGEGRLYEGLLHPVGSALATGEVDAGKAAVFAELLVDQPPPVCFAVCEQVLPQAPGMTRHALRRRIRAVIIQVDPATAGERATVASSQRRLEQVRLLPDGLASLRLVAPVMDVATVYTAAEAAARAARSGGDPRTLDQLRADALTAMAADALAAGRVDPHRARAEVIDPPSSRDLAVVVGPGARACASRGRGPDPADAMPEPVGRESELTGVVTEQVVRESELTGVVTEQVVRESEPRGVVTEQVVRESEPRGVVTEPVRATSVGTAEPGFAGPGADALALARVVSEARARAGVPCSDQPSREGERTPDIFDSIATIRAAAEQDASALGLVRATVTRVRRAVSSSTVHRHSRATQAPPPVAAHLLGGVLDPLAELPGAGDHPPMRRFGGATARLVLALDPLHLRSADPKVIHAVDPWVRELDGANLITDDGDPFAAYEAPAACRIGVDVPELVGVGPLDPVTARAIAERSDAWVRVSTALADDARHGDTGESRGCDEREGEGEARDGGEPRSESGVAADGGPSLEGAGVADGDPRSGEVQHGYVPGAPLARLVRGRHPTCVAPGCAVPSSACDLDHVVAWPLGATTASNLRPLCRRHHVLKTHEGHDYELTAEGAARWTTPNGHVYLRPPGGETTLVHGPGLERLTRAGG